MRAPRIGNGTPASSNMHAYPAGITASIGAGPAEAIVSGDRPGEFSRNVAFVEVVLATGLLARPHTPAKVGGTEKVAAAVLAAVGCGWVVGVLVGDGARRTTA